MKLGTQIACIPPHVREIQKPLAELLEHPDVEFGFVMLEFRNAHFCRYWRKGHPGELRTVSNSELTRTNCLVDFKSVNQSIVDQLIRQIALEHHEQRTNWISLQKERPEVGAWVLMYLSRYLGMDKFRAGMYMGPDDWMSAANWNEPKALLRDLDISHWMPLPEPPSDYEEKDEHRDPRL